MILSHSRSSRLLKTYITLFVVVMLAALFSDAAAMRCGTNLVEPGDSQYEVAIKCGKPTLVEQNRWHYDWGPHTFIKILYFTNGQLQTIDNGKYGSSGINKQAPASVIP
jgi:Protein of unknown function (DUF2845)